MISLFVGSNATSAGAGDPIRLTGRRCFTPVHRPPSLSGYGQGVEGLLDSGAFSDPPHRRKTPDTALERQLAWEERASATWQNDWQASALVSYDLLIDEKWDGERRRKERWSVADAEAAMETTIEAATYLSSQRTRLEPRRLVLACQGVDATQYSECVAEILKIAQPQNWIGLGGWCILGRYSRQWMPTFWASMRQVLPRIAAAGLTHVHTFGVLYQPALGGLLWLADQHGISVSTDSAAPILALTKYGGNPVKSGARADTWQGNVEWWQATLASMRSSAFYREPPASVSARQLSLFNVGAYQ